MVSLSTQIFIWRPTLKILGQVKYVFKPLKSLRHRIPSKNGNLEFSTQTSLKGKYNLSQCIYQQLFFTNQNAFCTRIHMHRAKSCLSNNSVLSESWRYKCIIVQVLILFKPDLRGILSKKCTPLFLIRVMDYDICFSWQSLQPYHQEQQAMNYLLYMRCFQVLWFLHLGLSPFELPSLTADPSYHFPLLSVCIPFVSKQLSYRTADRKLC